MTTDLDLSLPHPDPGPGWRLRFWTFFAGQGLSLVGSALTQFVLIWWITDTTGSASALALAGTAALLPQALLGPLAGALADRWNRRLLLMVSDAVSALCMIVLIALFLADAIALWHAYTLMAVRSAMQAIQAPAAAASTPLLVPVEFLPRAAGLNQTLQGVMTIAAAPLGALAIAFMPIGWALSIDVATAALAILTLFFLRIPPTAKSAGGGNLLLEIRDGFEVVWRHRGLRSLYFVLACTVLVVMPSFTLVALLVKAYFGGGANEVALMEALTGAAMIVAGIVVATLAPRRPVRWIIFGFAISCFAVAGTAAPPAPWFWVSVVAWTISGFAFVCGSAPLTALLQTVVPNRLQGRAFALLTTVTGLAAPIGMAAAGPLGEAIGIRGLFLAMGVGGGLIALAGYLSPSIRALDDVAPGPGDGDTDLRLDPRPDAPH